MWGLLQGENSFSFRAWWNVTTRSAIKNPVCIRRFFCRPKPSLCLLLFTISIIPRSSAWIMVFCYLWQSEPPLWRWWLSLNAACSFLPRFFFLSKYFVLTGIPAPSSTATIFHICLSLSHTSSHFRKHGGFPQGNLSQPSSAYSSMPHPSSISAEWLSYL